MGGSQGPKHECVELKVDKDGFKGFSDRLQMQMDQKLSALNFSGVTAGLDDVHDALNGQGMITKKGGINLSSQPEPDQEALDLFYAQMKLKFSNLQYETARRVFLRTMKDTVFVENGVQVGESELNDEIGQQLRE